MCILDVRRISESTRQVEVFPFLASRVSMLAYIPVYSVYFNAYMLLSLLGVDYHTIRYELKGKYE